MDISVIVPAYNVEQYIKRCINSLINQTYKGSYEVIIIDDGSVDRTSEIAKEAADNNPSLIRYYRKENGGQSSARNIGIKAATGSYLAFVDSDDYIEPSYLQDLYDLCVLNEADISMCAMNRCSGDDGKGKIFDSGFRRDFISNNIHRIIMFSSYAPWNKLFSKKLFYGDKQEIDLLFPEGMTYEDMALIPQLMYRAKKIAYTNNILYHYFINENSTILKLHNKKRTDFNIIKAQNILEHSELRNDPGVLGTIYIKRVLLSMGWSIIKNNENFDDFKKLVICGKHKYNDLNKNPFLQNTSQVQRLFIHNALGENWGGCYMIVKTYSLLQSLYRLAHHNK